MRNIKNYQQHLLFYYSLNKIFSEITFDMGLFNNCNQTVGYYSHNGPSFCLTHLLCKMSQMSSFCDLISTILHIVPLG